MKTTTQRIAQHVNHTTMKFNTISVWHFIVTYFYKYMKFNDYTWVPTQINTQISQVSEPLLLLEREHSVHKSKYRLQQCDSLRNLITYLSYIQSAFNWNNINYPFSLTWKCWSWCPMSMYKYSTSQWIYVTYQYCQLYNLLYLNQSIRVQSESAF